MQFIFPEIQHAILKNIFIIVDGVFKGCHFWIIMGFCLFVCLFGFSFAFLSNIRGISAFIPYLTF